MKSGERSIKRRIKRRVEAKMGVRDKYRITPNHNPLPVGLVSRHELRTGKSKKKYTGLYQKKTFVDYDVVICIPSHDRYKKVKRLISQFYEQQTKYTFKIVLLNDGSPSHWYDKIPKDFSDITYLKNEKPNGKAMHWHCYNQLWEELKNIECHAVLQMDDDFILSDNFLDTIVDKFFELKETDSAWMAITPHLWSFKKISDFESWWNQTNQVDGIALIDDMIIKKMGYGMQPVDVEAVSKPGMPVRAWVQIARAINGIGGNIYRTENSLVYHDGNEDSKLHGDWRGAEKGVFTQKYVGEL